MYDVVKINTQNGVQWVLRDKEGLLAVLPCRFLKHLRIVGKSVNTQKSYAYALKYLSEYLDGKGLTYTDVTMRNIFEFLAWLQIPSIGSKIVELHPTKIKRSAITVNTYISGVMSFYQYLYSIGEMDKDLHADSLKSVSSLNNPTYKDFLYHTHKGEARAISRLKVKAPKKAKLILSPGEVRTILSATTNIRDRLLVYTLYVSGIRIGELLSLYNEDFVFDHSNGHYIQLTNRGELPNGGMLKTGERKVFVNQELMDLYDDYQYEMLDRFDKDTNFLFVKLAGKNAGAPMDYNDVMSVFRRLRKKTGLDFHPHTFRHTHATMYYAKTKNVKSLQDRLGHKDVQTTLNTYVHPTTEDILNDWKNVSDSFIIGGID